MIGLVRTGSPDVTDQWQVIQGDVREVLAGMGAKLDSDCKVPIMMVLGMRGHFAFEAVHQNSDSGQNALHQAGECLAVSLAGRLLDEGRSVVKSGIYQIRNRINGKRYVGSAVNVQCRWREHLGDLRNQSHHNAHLQRAFNRYREDAFTFSILEYIQEPDNLIGREQHYLDTLKPEYNISPTAGSPLGVRHTEETRRKVSAAMMGHPVSSETRVKISEALTGRHRSGEHCRKISLAMRGRIVSRETRQKMSRAHRGKPRSAETKQKISEGNKGKILSEETRAKLSKALRAYWHKVHATGKVADGGQEIRR